MVLHGLKILDGWNTPKKIIKSVLKRPNFLNTGEIKRSLQAMSRKKNSIPEVKVIFKNDLSFEDQQKRVDKINDIFVDIATRYHVEKFKEKQTK
jgi:hypothetical protein